MRAGRNVPDLEWAWHMLKTKQEIAEDAAISILMEKIEELEMRLRAQEAHNDLRA